MYSTRSEVEELIAQYIHFYNYSLWNQEQSRVIPRYSATDSYFSCLLVGVQSTFFLMDVQHHFLFLWSSLCLFRRIAQNAPVTTVAQCINVIRGQVFKIITSYLSYRITREQCPPQSGNLPAAFFWKRAFRIQNLAFRNKKSITWIPMLY